MSVSPGKSGQRIPALPHYLFSCSVVHSGDGTLLPVCATTLAKAIVHQGVAQPGGLLGFGVHHFRGDVSSLAALENRVKNAQWKETTPKAAL